MRTVLAPTRVAAALVAISFVVGLVLAVTFASPVAAQEGRSTGEEGDDQAAARAAEAPLQNAPVEIVTGPGDAVVSIEIAVADCDVEKGATVTVDEADVNPVTFVDGVARSEDEIDASIQPTQDQVVIDDFAANEIRSFGDEGAVVTDSSGVTCGRDMGQAAVGGDDETGTGTDTDDLENLDCEELLVLFRGEGQGQYEDDETAVDLSDSEVRARVEVCLEREIVNEPEGKLPKTGGVSLLALAVLGVVSAVAALSLVRGGRRHG